MKLAFAALAAAACTNGICADSPGRATGPDFGPPVDAACLERAKAGTLLDDLPHELGGFDVVRDGRTVYLRRAGRKLEQREGIALWKTMTETYFGRGHFAMAHHAFYSVYKCPDVADASCMSFNVWMCQTDLATVASLATAAAADVGAGDGELELAVTPIEGLEKPCRDCGPEPHYSRKHVRYDPARGRTRSVLGGRGQCTTDGECHGHQECVAWYLAGGWETLEYRILRKPTFCGCVDHACTWFTQ